MTEEEIRSELCTIRNRLEELASEARDGGFNSKGSHNDLEDALQFAADTLADEEND